MEQRSLEVSFEYRPVEMTKILCGGEGGGGGAGRLLKIVGQLG